MALWLTNDDVKKFLDLKTAIEALRESYLQLIKGEAICRYRLTMRIPTANPNEVFETNPARERTRRRTPP